jgi:Putative auto-transporter adhesin, head GIN domain
VSELKANASGGSDIIISGTAKNIDIDASGGSDFKGYELQTENCKANASGGSDIFITVNKELTVDASGGSDVHYKGTGLIRDIKSNGGGSVKRASK